MASTGIYAPKWTQLIDDEWMRSLEEQRGKPAGTFITRRDAMRTACPDWEVPEASWKALAPGLSLPDVDDVHVLAAAMAGHADCIVTANLKDFPKDGLEPFGIEVLHPDQFLINQLDLDPFRVLPAFKEMRGRLKNPAYSPEVFADALERHGLVQTSQLMREAASLI